MGRLEFSLPAFFSPGCIHLQEWDFSREEEWLDSNGVLMVTLGKKMRKANWKTRKSVKVIRKFHFNNTVSMKNEKM